MRNGEWLQTEFARSLHALAPGASVDCSALAYRIEDGGDKAKNEQPADFAFFGNSGRCCHIECKETADFQPFEHILLISQCCQQNDRNMRHLKIPFYR